MAIKIYLKFRSKKEEGYLEGSCKYSYDYYFKNGYLSDLRYFVACDKTISEKDYRYIFWMDKTGYIKSNNKYGIENLNRKRPIEGRYVWPRGFDHTTQWRNIGDKFPRFILTEPYDISDENIKEWDHYSRSLDLKYKIIEPSKNSLWVTSSTYMVFWYSPNFMSFKDIKIPCSASETKKHYKIVIES